MLALQVLLLRVTSKHLNDECINCHLGSTLLVIKVQLHRFSSRCGCINCCKFSEIRMGRNNWVGIANASPLVACNFKTLK